jgi:hypothetical protein
LNLILSDDSVHNTSGTFKVVTAGDPQTWDYESRGYLPNRNLSSARTVCRVPTVQQLLKKKTPFWLPQRGNPGCSTLQGAKTFVVTRQQTFIAHHYRRR